MMSQVLFVHTKNSSQSMKVCIGTVLCVTKRHLLYTSVAFCIYSELFEMVMLTTTHHYKISILRSHVKHLKLTQHYFQSETNSRLGFIRFPFPSRVFLEQEIIIRIFLPTSSTSRLFPPTKLFLSADFFLQLTQPFFDRYSNQRSGGRRGIQNVAFHKLLRFLSALVRWKMF